MQGNRTPFPNPIIKNRYFERDSLQNKFVTLLYILQIVRALIKVNYCGDYMHYYQAIDNPECPLFTAYIGGFTFEGPRLLFSIPLRILNPSGLN